MHTPPAHDGTTHPTGTAIRRSRTVHFRPRRDKRADTGPVRTLGLVVILGEVAAPRPGSGRRRAPRPGPTGTPRADLARRRPGRAATRRDTRWNASNACPHAGTRLPLGGSFTHTADHHNVERPSSRKAATAGEPIVRARPTAPSRGDGRRGSARSCATGVPGAGFPSHRRPRRQLRRPAARSAAPPPRLLHAPPGAPPSRRGRGRVRSPLPADLPDLPEEQRQARSRAVPHPRLYPTAPGGCDALRRRP